MLQTVLTAIMLYVATAVDLLVILLIYFARVTDKRQVRDIYLGQYLGSVTLIVVSLFFAFVLHYVPEKWLLGLLGLIPIYFGIRVWFVADTGEERAESRLKNKGLSQLTATVAIVTIGSCGADNLGLFVPYFVTLDRGQLVATLITFLVMIYLLVFTAQKISGLPHIGAFIERYNRWVISAIYLGLGAFIIVDNGTIPQLLKFL
ncbi:MAG: CadD family cadmium resistance transporter [Levilactobacillus sp.]|jgi:cadmium resistance transport/sequestration family protein|uniref:CadD family cadmium resistance transporter n=1 Tax=Levilactobacillus sp. TaxID=2767919 RepID=UPI002587C30D|nr:CadD family cadmium resistance transporter [Levilactobacillus sp.]MCI1553354.1 CadD family cadmium resistance transporter [Levilactobacillus sp.]MCI1599580.1 CadD family cadmium resistance transporter [Levilactobacillus sp.]MCI1606112.1 CadD family cadmium resistance transporter [Levilactobacillus sp.]